MEGRNYVGRVIVCRGIAVKTPYYVAGAGRNVFSLEELCYLLYRSTYLVESDLFGEELFGWIEKSQRAADLAEKLRRKKAGNASMASLVETLFRETDLYPESVWSDVVERIRETEKMDRFEKQKRRADHLAANGYYYAAIRDYEEILKGKPNLATPTLLLESHSKDYEMAGAVYNNLGYCYAKMFLFPAAASFFEKAYHINGRSGCLLEYMAAMKLSLPEEEYKQKVLTNLKSAGLEPDLQAKIDRFEAEYAGPERNERLKNLFDALATGKRNEYYACQEELVNELREDYRKNENEFI